MFRGELRRVTCSHPFRPFAFALATLAKQPCGFALGLAEVVLPEFEQTGFLIFQRGALCEGFVGQIETHGELPAA
jgi:hypothetical protein